MFNTLLRQLRLSIDYALTGSYDGAVTLGTKIIKEHEECMFQEAVIKTIGGARGGGAGLPLKVIIRVWQECCGTDVIHGSGTMGSTVLGWA